MTNVVCPSCRGPLGRDADGALTCRTCSVTYPVRGGVDILLPPAEWTAAEEQSRRDGWHMERYNSARRSSPLVRIYYDWWVRRLLSCVPRDSVGMILELMCGGAEICRRLPPRFTEALALDANAWVLERAAKDLLSSGERRVRLVCGTVLHLPIPDRSVPVVIVQGGLHHVRRDLGSVLEEVRRVLEPGGRLIASEPADDNPLIHAIRRWQYRRSEMLGRDPDEGGFSRQELERALAGAGMRLESYQRFGFVAYPLLCNMDVLPLLSGISAPWVGRALVFLDEMLERMPLIRGLAFANIFTATPVASS